MHLPATSIGVSTFDREQPQPQATGRGRLRGLREIDRPRLALALVAIAHGLLPLLFLGANHFYGHDETVYLSQYSSHSPAAYFSAPRSRGTPLLVAPITALTASLPALRIYLAMLSGLFTYVAFMPWFGALRSAPRRISPYVVPLAAALLSTLWVSIYYSFAAMPDEWSMLAVVAAVGLVLSAGRRPRTRTAIGIVLALALAGLLRPQDSLWPGAALVLCIALFRNRTVAERLRLIGLVGLGLVIGWADWIAEAYAYFGGPLHRIHDSLAINGGAGMHFSLKAQWSVLAGPALCRRGCVAHPAGIDQIWWVAGALLVATALVVARQRESSRIVAVSVACGFAVVVEYTASVNYGAPRFLLPAYGLLSIPVAMALVWLARSWKPLIPVIVLGCVAQVAIQTHVLLDSIKAPIQHSAASKVALATRLEQIGVDRPGCQLFWNRQGVVAAYVLGCLDHLLSGTNPTRPPAIAGTHPVYVITKRRPVRPTWYDSWPAQRVHVGHSVVYVWTNRLADPAMSFDIVAQDGRADGS